ICPGNHDRDFGDTYGVYINHFGTDYYTFNLGPEIFIIMGNSHHSPYEFNTTLLGWVERDFAASNAKLKIFAGHAPLMNPEFYSYFLSQWEREEMQRIFDTFNVSVYLSGHLHGDLVNIINDTYWIQTAPAGGSPRMYDPFGHKSRGLRALNFTNYELATFSWVDLNWSQSIDALYIDRAPLAFRDTDIGAYISVKNTLGFGVMNKVVDVLVDPLIGPEVYRVTGGTVLETVNGTDAWLIRISLDVADGETGVIRVFTSNAQTPVISAVDYPTTATIQNLVHIYANVSNPASGIHRVTINRSFAGDPYTTSNMAKAGPERYRYLVYLTIPGNYWFSLTAADYAGYNVTTMLYSFTVTHEAPSAPELEVLNGVSETGNVTLTWTPSIDPDGFIANYTLQISNTSDFSFILGEHNSSILQYTFTELSSGDYYFRIRSVDNFNAPSPWSNIVSASVELPTTPPPPPPPPPLPTEILLAIVGVVVIIIVVVVVVYFFKIRSRSTAS
ncbi:MAG: metallophosphoesterase, partial [Candidatus Hermodarchaeia archaeon]